MAESAACPFDEDVAEFVALRDEQLPEMHEDAVFDSTLYGAVDRAGKVGAPGVPDDARRAPASFPGGRGFSVSVRGAGRSPFVTRGRAGDYNASLY